MNISKISTNIVKPLLFSFINPGWVKLVMIPLLLAGFILILAGFILILAGFILIHFPIIKNGTYKEIFQKKKRFPNRKVQNAFKK